MRYACWGSALRGALALALVIWANAGFAQSPQEIAEAAFSSTVTVLAFDEFGQPLGLGSGFVVDTDQILTNAHVIAGATSLLVRAIGAPDALAVSALLRVDVDVDLALLETPGLDRPALTFRPDDVPAVGDTIYAVGSPLGLDGTFSQGIVSGFRTEGGARLMQITAPISPGSSGGPILDARGQLVGVAIGTFTAGQNLNFAVPITAVSTFMATPVNRQTVASAHTLEIGDAGRGNGQVDGLIAGAFLFDITNSYSFSIRNNLARAVRNINVIVVFYDSTGFPVETDLVRVRDTILPGLGTRVSSRVDTSVKTIMTGARHMTDPISPIEIRFLDFEFAD